MSKKKMPTERAMQYMRARGVLVDKVERYIKAPNLTHQGGGLRKDLFGIIDLIAIRENRIIGIQCSGITNVSSHIKKIEESENAIPWLLTGAGLEVWAFKKSKRILKDGTTGAQDVYEPVIREITIPKREAPPNVPTSGSFGQAELFNNQSDYPDL